MSLFQRLIGKLRLGQSVSTVLAKPAHKNVEGGASLGFVGGGAWERRLGLAMPAKKLSPPSPGIRAKASELLAQKVDLSMPMVFFGAFCMNNLIQDYLGSQEDFFHGSFVTDKDPDAIAELYQAEDLLKLIAIHPFMFSMFMDRVKVGESPESEEEMHLSMEESRMIVQNLGMEASFVITEEEEEIDGQNVRTSFKRYERFLDYVPILHDYGTKILLWDQTWTFGFRRLEDGRYEVYHTGHSFWGPWPVRIIIHLHQRYLLWACKDLMTSKWFASEADDAMEKCEEIMCPTVAGAVGKVARWVGSEVAAMQLPLTAGGALGALSVLTVQRFSGITTGMHALSRSFTPRLALA